MEIKKITVDNQEISYSLRKSRRATRMRLAVYGDGRVVLTSPFYQIEKIAEGFIRQKTGWLLEKLEIFKKRERTSPIRHTHADYLKMKSKALELVLERVQYFSNLHGFKYNRISIKNQRTCWGSCSRKGNLNFNYKLVYLSPQAQDYIILHELCHLKEFNHSKKFWSLVESILPNYLDLKREIRQFNLV